MDCPFCGKSKIDIGYHVFDMQDLGNVTDMWFTDYEEAKTYYDESVESDKQGDWRLLKDTYCLVCNYVIFEDEYLEAHIPD